MNKKLSRRVHRITLYLKELEYQVFDEDINSEFYTAELETPKGVRLGMFIDKTSPFGEFIYTFSFSLLMGEFLKTRIEEIMKICYEFGCYFNMNQNGGEINFSLFSKIYFTGLNYHSLYETLNDHLRCVNYLTQLLDFDIYQNKAERGV
ncbi:MAG: hypothetical protein JXR70_07685 [Spirochaetales bacterium]|nr:hypothetical protein [Spirochaetales bacterium]